MGEQRFGRFLKENNPGLLKEFLLNNLEAIKSRYNPPASFVRTYFFQNYGIQNAAVLRLMGKRSMTEALNKQKGQSAAKGETKGGNRGAPEPQTNTEPMKAERLGGGLEAASLSSERRPRGLPVERRDVRKSAA